MSIYGPKKITVLRIFIKSKVGIGHISPLIELLPVEYLLTAKYKRIRIVRDEFLNQSSFANAKQAIENHDLIAASALVFI